MSCKVAYCQYGSTHVTKGHKCGRCGKYGHGQVECLEPWRMSLLQRYEDDIIFNDRICTVDDCLYKQYHTTLAHHCPKCGKREAHTASDCGHPITYNVKCPLCRTDNTVTNPTKIEGLTDQCVICMDENVQILFGNCNHRCVCMKCLQKL